MKNNNLKLLLTKELVLSAAFEIIDNKINESCEELKKILEDKNNYETKSNNCRTEKT